jgi:hypothetical protein
MILPSHDNQHNDIRHQDKKYDTHHISWFDCVTVRLFYIDFKQEVKCIEVSLSVRVPCFFHIVC